jgi:cell volume regulation protein A
VGGIALAALLRATPRLEETIHAVAFVTGAVIVGAATASLHGSGFLAVYLAGLFLSDEWSKREGRHHAIPQGLAGVAEPVLFGLLGAAFAPVVIGADVWQGIVLTVVTVLLLRPLIADLCLRGSGLRHSERLLVSWGGLKGAVPLLLAAYPALESLDVSSRVEGIVLVATAASIVLQGTSLSFVADRLVAPSRRLPRSAEKRRRRWTASSG